MTVSKRYSRWLDRLLYMHVLHNNTRRSVFLLQHQIPLWETPGIYLKYRFLKLVHRIFRRDEEHSLPYGAVLREMVQRAVL